MSSTPPRTPERERPLQVPGAPQRRRRAERRNPNFRGRRIIFGEPDGGPQHPTKKNAPKPEQSALKF